MLKDGVKLNISGKYHITIKSCKEMAESLQLEELALSILVTRSISEDMRIETPIEELISVYGFTNVQWVLAASVIDANLNGSIYDWANSIVGDIPRRELTQYVSITEPLKRILKHLVCEYFRLLTQEITSDDNKN